MIFSNLTIPAMLVPLALDLARGESSVNVGSKVLAAFLPCFHVTVLHVEVGLEPQRPASGVTEKPAAKYLRSELDSSCNKRDHSQYTDKKNACSAVFFIVLTAQSTAHDTHVSLFLN